jgi:bacterioferritin-associated ferredoxin
VIVCQCRVVSDRTIEAAVATGMSTLSAVCRETGAARTCGACILTVKALVCRHHGQGRDPEPGPGSLSVAEGRRIGTLSPLPGAALR